MADDYEFNDSPEEEQHPLDVAERQGRLRINRVLRSVFENLEKQPQEPMAKFPAWVYVALADMMAYSVIRESYKNRSPASVEEFYKRQGAIQAYENLGLLFSEEAAKRLEPAEEGKGGK